MFVPAHPRMTLKEALVRAASAGTPIEPSAACAIFLGALRLADEKQATLSTASVLLGDEGDLAVELDEAGAQASSDDLVAAARSFADDIFGARAPFTLGRQDSAGGGPFPTLRHLINAVEFQLLRARAGGGPPPPTRADCRLAVARLLADARQASVDPATDPPAPLELPQPPLPESAPGAAPSQRQEESRPRARFLGMILVAVASLLAGALLASSLRGPQRLSPPPRLAEPTSAAAAVAALCPLPASTPPPVVESTPPALAPPPALARPAAAPSARPSPRRLGATAKAPAARAREELERGEKALESGRIFEALVAFHDALDEEPPPPQAARRLGDAYRLQEEDALALAAYQRYLELAPGAPDAAQVRAIVEELRAANPADE